MKYLYLFVFALLISSCNRNKYLEFDGTIAGISNGVIAIKSQDGAQLLSAFITEGKFKAKMMMQTQGFYDLYIIPDIEKQTDKKLFEVYLQSGNYTLTADKDKLYLYPVIKSDSKIQNELSDYYNISLAKDYALKRQKDSINDILYGPNTPIVVKSPEYYSLKKQLASSDSEANVAMAKVLDWYVNKNPQNSIEAFILSQTDYKKDIVDYYNIYKKFNDEQKHTPEGKDEGDELTQLAKDSLGNKH